MRLNDRDIDICAGLAEAYADLHDGDGRKGQAWEQLTDELLRNTDAGRRWITPTGTLVGRSEAVRQWMAHVKARRQLADAGLL